MLKSLMGFINFQLGGENVMPNGDKLVCNQECK